MVFLENVVLAGDFSLKEQGQEILFMDAGLGKLLGYLCHRAVHFPDQILVVVQFFPPGHVTVFGQDLSDLVDPCFQGFPLNAGTVFFNLGLSSQFKSLIDLGLAVEHPQTHQQLDSNFVVVPLKALMPFIRHVVALKRPAGLLLFLTRDHQMIPFEQGQLAADRHGRQVQLVAQIFDGKPTPGLLEEFQDSLVGRSLVLQHSFHYSGLKGIGQTEPNRVKRSETFRPFPASKLSEKKKIDLLYKNV